MKRKIALNVLYVISLLLFLGLSGCSGTSSSTRSDDQQTPPETPEQQSVIELQSVSLAAGNSLTIGLKSDGTLLADYSRTSSMESRVS